MTRGVNLSARVIAEIRQKYADGWPIDEISRDHRVNRSTVNKHCEDIPEPERTFQKISNESRSRLLKNWGRVSYEGKP